MQPFLPVHPVQSTLFATRCDQQLFAQSIRLRLRTTELPRLPAFDPVLLVSSTILIAIRRLSLLVHCAVMGAVATLPRIVHAAAGEKISLTRSCSALQGRRSDVLRLRISRKMRCLQT